MRTEPGSGIPVATAYGEHILSLRDFFQIIWKRLWVILLVTTVVTLGTVGFSLWQTPMYEATIELLVGQERGTTSEGLGGEVQGLQQLTQTMAKGVDSRPIAEAVIQQHDLQMSPQDFLDDYLRVEQVGDTQFIQVAYRDPSPERAQLVANTIGEVFSEQVSNVSPSANDVTVTLWDRAEVPDKPVSPDLVLNIGLALGIGLLLGVGLAFLLEYLDDSWRSPEEAEQISGVPTFGVISEFEVSKDKKESSEALLTPKHRQAQRKNKANDLTARMVTMLEPSSVASEDYRSLRTNLLYAFVDNPPKVIVVTSPGPQEGKSTTCANLGVVLVQAGKRTLLLDCDFRKPVLHRIFGIRNICGVVDLLAGGNKLQEVWQEPVPGLKVVSVGPIPPNPAEILGSRRLSELLASLREEFDYVLVDAPPIGLVSDPAILATQGDGVLLVLDAQNTRKGALRQSVRSLEAVGANVLGTVMNNTKASGTEYYRYRY